MLKCILCGKTIVYNDLPVHYGVCSGCDVRDLTKEQEEIIWKQCKEMFK